MEIWNNIWTALTTENEVLVKIITIPGIFIEMYLSFSLFTLILKTTYTKRQKYLYVFTIFILSSLGDFFIPQPFNVIVNYLIIFLALVKFLNLNFLQAIAAIIIPLSLFGLVSSLLLNPFLKIFNLSYETALAIPIYRLSYALLTYVILFLIITILRHINMKSFLNIKYDKKTLKIILVNLILAIFTLFIQTFLTVEYFGNIPIVFTLFNFSLLLAYLIISFYSLIKAMKLDITTRDLENAESYNNSLTVLYDNVKGFKHDFDNIVNSISGYIKVDDMDGLKKYFSDFEKECNKVRNVQLLNPNIINNPAIYNLIVSKYKRATDLGIAINFEFFFDFENLKIPIYEFSRILGILLDNAIEAAKDCDEKKINLMFRDSPKQQVQIIKIENTYLDKNIDTKKIFEKGVSGKASHSGIGLWEVNKIVMSHNNIVLNTTNDDELFKQELQIYY